MIKKDKCIFFIMGGAGTGKTVLAFDLKDRLSGSKMIYDDYHLTDDRNFHYDVRKAIIRSRHTNDKVIIVCKTIPFRQGYNFKNNKHITWIFTSINESESFKLLMNGLPHRIIKKFRRLHMNADMHKLKTIPYLVITLSPKRRVIAKIHRIKRKSGIEN